MTTELIVQQPPLPTLMRPIATPKELISYHEDMTKIIREALKDGTDYGIIPGTKKPTLYKAGAERINIAFGTHPEYHLIEKEIDHDRECTHKYGKSYGLYRYVYKCRIVKTVDGTCIGEGEGVCSTLEAKYISRPRDSENTACKMAQKRAFMAATLHAFGLSDRFTQDLEEQQHDEPINVSPYRTAPPPPPMQVVPQIFSDKNLTHIERLEKKLIEMSIASEHHLKIAQELDGKPFSAFDSILKSYLLQVANV